MNNLPSHESSEVPENDLPADTTALQPDMEEDAPAQALTPLAHEDAPAPRRGIAPVWHTVVLVMFILGFSVLGALRSTPVIVDPIVPAEHGAYSSDAVHVKAPVNFNRLLHYSVSGCFEIILAGWAVFGLRLRRTSIRSLFGAWPRGLNDVTKEIGIAALFWICSMVVLGSFALTWNVVQTKIYEHQVKQQAKQVKEESQPRDREAAGKNASSEGKKPESPQKQQVEMARKLMEYAPANGLEIAAWGLLCLIVGFSEELVFRGYLQQQGISLLRSVMLGVLFSALIFGGAHGYQGVRGVCLITLYGGLFSVITLLRRNLFPGMLAHGWHDFATGLALALVRSTHMLDRIPLSQ